MKILILTALLCSTAHAVCSEGRPSVKKEYGSSQAVIIATVTHQNPVPETRDGSVYEGTNYRLKVDRVFRGRFLSGPTIFSENSSGRFPMEVNRKYLLFIYQQGGRYSVDNCGNSGLLTSDLAVLQAVKKPPHTK